MAAEVNAAEYEAAKAEDRPDHAYARRGNVLLPLRFARLMPEWGREEPG